MKISFQGERVAFTLNLSFGFKLKPSNKTLREFRKQERINRYNSKHNYQGYEERVKPVDIN